MSDELPNEHLIDPTPSEFGFTSDEERIERMENELAGLRRVLSMLVEDRPDLLLLLGHPPTMATQDRS